MNEWEKRATDFILVSVSFCIWKRSIKLISFLFVWERETLAAVHSTHDYGFWSNHSAGKHDRAFFFLILLYPLYYLPPFTIYRHLLFTLIYYLPPLLIYPLYYFSGIKTHRKSFRRFIFSSKHSHLMSKMTGIRNSYVEIFEKFA